MDHEQKIKNFLFFFTYNCIFENIISTLRLFHSFMQYGKNVFLKGFVLDEIDFIIEADADLGL